MYPIKFTQSNTTFAKEQPQYISLPAYLEDSEEGRVISCWQLSWKERIKILWGGKLWLTQLTFQQSLQPQLPAIDSPFRKACPHGKGWTDYCSLCRRINGGG